MTGLTAQTEVADVTNCDEISSDYAIPVIGNSADVAYQIKQIGVLMDSLKSYAVQKEEAVAFYDRRMDALQQRADMLKENIGRWLKMNSLKKLSTHEGTIFFTKRTKVTLPDDEVLEVFINSLPEEIARDQFYNRSIRKSEVKQYIQSSGIKPEGYIEEATESITIRKAA